MTDKLQTALAKFNHEGHRVHFLMHPEDKPHFKTLLDMGNNHAELVSFLKMLLASHQSKGAATIGHSALCKSHEDRLVELLAKATVK